MKSTSIRIFRTVDSDAIKLLRYVKKRLSWTSIFCFKLQNSRSNSCSHYIQPVNVIFFRIWNINHCVKKCLSHGLYNWIPLIGLSILSNSQCVQWQCREQWKERILEVVKLLLLAGNSVQCESHLSNGAAMLFDADVVNREHCQLYPRRQARIVSGYCGHYLKLQCVGNTKDYTSSLLQCSGWIRRFRCSLVRSYNTTINTDHSN